LRADFPEENQSEKEMTVRGSVVLAKITANCAFCLLQLVLGKQLARMQQSVLGPYRDLLRRAASICSAWRRCDSSQKDHCTA